MSGLEVAGLVLGAFPVAIGVLGTYKEVAKRLGFWYKIAAEHKKCDSQLKFQQLVYENNLKRLLLPLAGLDDAHIDGLLKDPGGKRWTEAEVAKILEQRLGDSCEIYLQCMNEFHEWIESMNLELAFDVVTRQPSHGSGPAVSSRHDMPFTSLTIHIDKLPWNLDQVRSKAEVLKDKTKWQLYRIKFSQGEKEREEIFSKLENCNGRLKKLLQISEDDAILTSKRASAKTFDSNALCRFWRQASRVFSALALAWSCSCQAEHSARLLLEHRTGTTTDFRLLYLKAIKYPEEARKIIITEKSADAEDSASVGAITQKGGAGVMSSHNPNHRLSVPVRSAMKTRTSCNSGKLRAAGSTSVTMTQAENSSASRSIPMSLTKPITDLCRSLKCSDNRLCGFITEEDYKYYVYQEPSVPGHSNSHGSVTLDRLLQDVGLPRPTRRQRIALAFILSSSFLQLLESPWLSTSWQKSDVVFFADPIHPGVFRIDEPHLDNCLRKKADAIPPTENSRRMQLSSSLEILGIVLLELCFGKLLKDQPCRVKYPNTGDSTIERALDIQAAREWHGEIEEEAGHDYSVAVGWCLGGILSTPPDRWRETMHSKVVQSLESCHKYLQ